MDTELDDFCEEILTCLVKYGKIESAIARLLLEKSKVCECKTELDKDLLFHETPYYWAMHLLYSASNPNWYQEPNLWPPPNDYLSKWYAQ